MLRYLNNEVKSTLYFTESNTADISSDVWRQKKVYFSFSAPNGENENVSFDFYEKRMVSYTKYEVVPGSMGNSEFVIEMDEIENFLHNHKDEN